MNPTSESSLSSVPFSPFPVYNERRNSPNASNSPLSSISNPINASVNIFDSPTPIPLDSSTLNSANSFNISSLSNYNVNPLTTVNNPAPPVPLFNQLDFYSQLPNSTFNTLFPNIPESVFANKKIYKPSHRKVRPIPTTLPEEYRIQRIRPKIDPIESLPPLPTHPPPFAPTGRITEERIKKFNLDKSDFLWPEEVKLLLWVLTTNERAIAFEISERGTFSTKYFKPVIIPVVSHEPWAERNIPIPPGLYNQVMEVVRDKKKSGVYKPSSSSYRSKWFTVAKKDRKVRIVHDLQPLNRVTIKDAGVPPIADHFLDSFAARSCYSVLDLYVGYDHRLLDERSRDLTTFQTPIGTLRLTVLPMGWSNSVAIFQGDVAFMIEDEIPDIANVFIDDIGVKGPPTRYEVTEGYETIPENPGIRLFVWQHLGDTHRIFHRLALFGATVSGSKMSICVPEVTILGHVCTYEGRLPDPSSVQKIRDWPVPRNLTEVRAFLGVCGFVRIWIRNYSLIARPLIDLTKKDVSFEWTLRQQEAMDTLKEAVISSEALKPIDYTSNREVIIAVDSSVIAVGFILAQLDENNRRRPARYGSITWNEREARYSQAKLELYGLYRSLHSLRIFIIGITNLVVETDASYIKGMINNPDIIPSASINRWIAGIRLFEFELRHVPAPKHRAPDGLSRRPAAPEDPKVEDADDWLDERLEVFHFERFLSFNALSSKSPPTISTPPLPQLVYTQDSYITSSSPSSIQLPSATLTELNTKVDQVQSYLTTLEWPSVFDSPDSRAKFLRFASQFFIQGGFLYKRQKQGRHQRVLPISDRLTVLAQAHDDLGHRGFFPVRRALLDRFWWPSLAEDVKWYLKTCHICQLHSFFQLHLPPTISTPPRLFEKAYIDTMFMPSSNGYRYIVQARCALTSYPEWRALKRETSKTLSSFIFEDLLCRWGSLCEIVTDNGKAFVSALQELTSKYNVNHIEISPYNSQANGPVERSHRDIRESILKMAGNDRKNWPIYAAKVFWADRITTRKATGHSPYYMAHGVEPTLPFDISQSTYLFPKVTRLLTTQELIQARATQLLQRDEDIEQYRQDVHSRRILGAEAYTRRYAHNIRSYDFLPGTLVLVRDKQLEKAVLNKKYFPRFMGPFVVIKRRTNGSYTLAELDGTISQLRFAANRIIPYHPRDPLRIPHAHLPSIDDSSPTADLNAPLNELTGDGQYLSEEEL